MQVSLPVQKVLFHIEQKRVKIEQEIKACQEEIKSVEEYKKEKEQERENRSWLQKLFSNPNKYDWEDTFDQLNLHHTNIKLDGLTAELKKITTLHNAIKDSDASSVLVTDQDIVYYDIKTA